MLAQSCETQGLKTWFILVSRRPAGDRYISPGSTSNGFQMRLPQLRRNDSKTYDSAIMNLAFFSAARDNSEWIRN